MWLSTAPTEPLTHWYQVRCLLQSPLFTKAGDTLSGTALLVANKRYDAWAEAADFAVTAYEVKHFGSQRLSRLRKRSVVNTDRAGTGL